MSTETPILAGRYELGELLGRGGMAEVRLAKDTVLGRSVAIKLLRSDLTSDSMLQTRFRREAKAAASLNNSSVVAVFDTGDEVMPDKDGKPVRVPFIVMEYIDGGSLRELLREGPMPQDQALEVMDGVLGALSYSHKVGIVHRDIKPGNIMLTTQGKPKVMDFGIARAMADSASTDTRTQAVVGTAQYLSPEQAKGEEVDQRTDLYSVGCVLYELLTGRPPFLGDTPVAIAYQHVKETPILPSRISPGISPELDAVVMHSLQKNPEQRYQSAQEFREDIRAVLQDREPVHALAARAVTADAETISAVADEQTSKQQNVQEQPVTSKRSSRRFLWLWILLGALVLGTVGTGIWMYTNNAGIFHKAQTRTIPDLQRVSAEKALSHLETLGFKTIVLSEYNEKIAKDQVVRTAPKAGIQAEVGSTVTVVVSLGPESIKVPNLSGQDVEYAKKILEGMGLKTGEVKYEHSAKFDKDVVISSEPGNGKTIDPGSEVSLTVADGLVEVPNVVGYGKDLARNELVDLGLIVTVSFQESNLSAPDTVFTQTLGPGPVAKGSAITIYVAVAPTLQETPTAEPTTSSPSPSAQPTQTSAPPVEPSPSETTSVPVESEPEPEPSTSSSAPTSPSPSVASSSPSEPAPTSSAPSQSPVISPSASEVTSEPANSAEPE